MGESFKYFHANVPTSYTEKLVSEAVPKLGLDFIEKKDIYHVRVITFSELNMIKLFVLLI